jgi:hypothetical protein
MEEVYKRHIIRSGAAAMRGSLEWKPIAQINWAEDGKERVISGWNGTSCAVLRHIKTPKWKPTFLPKTGLIIGTEIPSHKYRHCPAPLSCLAMGELRKDFSCVFLEA